MWIKKKTQWINKGNADVRKERQKEIINEKWKGKNRREEWMEKVTIGEEKKRV